MTITVAGWLVALLTACAAALAWRRATMREEAVARACHELRGPLTAARLGLQLGARTGQLSAQRLRAIDLQLGRAGLALHDLDDVRDPGRLKFCEHVDMCELVADSVEAWGATAESRGAAIRMTWNGRPAWVRGDRLRIAQAAGNLIANALEHGGRSVEIIGGRHGAAVRVEVVDDGPGLSAPVAELTRHARAGRGRRGRGLAIASAIIEAHGGRLAAAPSDRGARLVIDLPIAPGQEGAQAPSG